MHFVSTIFFFFSALSVKDEVLNFFSKKIASSKILSAAVPHLPWLGTNGKPSSDVSAYAAVIDYVNIMYVVQSFLFFHSSFLSRDLTGIEQEL